MKHIKGFNEMIGVRDIYKVYKHFKTNDENEIAQKILTKLDGIDPELIVKDDCDYEFNLDNKIPATKVKVVWDPPCFDVSTVLGDYSIKINDLEVKCSELLIRKIHTKVKKMYNEEQNAQRRQKLGQII